MSQEPPKKKIKKKKQVSWDENPPNVSCSSFTDSIKKKGKSCIKLNNSHLNELKTDISMDSDNEGIPSLLDNFENEIEQKLEEKAAKNNLTVTNVKNILKAVITNKDVVDLVETSLKGESFDNFRPKFTRSKTKELLETFDLEQVESKKSDYVYLLEQELPEDSDDEEYTPNEDCDEENKIGDLIAESPVPDSPYFSSVCGEDEYEFENGENIGQRTRSKLSLSETPLEAIEQQFVPPDITNDMYDTECDNQDWLDFLKDINNPLDRTTDTVEDENDPEFNVMVEESIEQIDFEELRHDRAVKVSKAELHALMNEWFGCEDFSSEDEEEIDDILKKSLPKSSPLKNNEKNLSEKPEEHPNQVEREEILKNLQIYKRENFYSNVQYSLLTQQIQQHVQLLLQTFLLTYKHPYVDSIVPSSVKGMILVIKLLSENNKSTFNVVNLKPTVKLIENWINYLSNNNNFIQVTQFMSKEFQNGDRSVQRKKIVQPAKIPPQLISFCGDSTAFIFPLLLPHCGVYINKNASRNDYTSSEDFLIAIGLEEFKKEFIERNKTNPTLTELCKDITTYLMPNKLHRSILSHIKWLTKSETDNPVKFFMKNNNVPPVKHYVIVVEKLVKLVDQPQQLIPPNWKKHLFERRANIFPFLRVKR